MRIYFDTEFTGLHQNTNLISIGFVSENNKCFYAEFDDYDKNQVTDWVKDNVIDNLFHTKYDNDYNTPSYYHYGNTAHIKGKLKEYFAKFDDVEIWSDCLSYDWVLFNTLLADYTNGYPQLPKNINYIPFDICTLFKLKGIDPDISREEFVKDDIKKYFDKEVKHNSLFDAIVIKLCYEKLMKI